jgi:lysophospholipid acyltransferase (LPLAT)-like uncharacterized protein
MAAPPVSKYPLRRRIERWLSRLLITALVRLLGLTHRVRRVNWHVLERFERERQPYLLGLWHNNIFSAVCVLAPYRYPALISRSRDGEDINWVLERFGFEGLRGSSTAGASSVLRQALRTLAGRRAVIVTPDGPRGPRYVLKPGIIALARLSGAPIVPVCLSAAQRWEMGSWDRMRLIKPFARLFVLVGDPIRLARDDPHEEAQRLRVQVAMRELVRTAEALSGAAATRHDPALDDSPDNAPALAD